MDKTQIIETLRAFIAQKPGLEFANYGDVKAYRSEMRSITKDRHQAETLLNSVAWRDSITAADLVKAAEGAYSGRLSIKETDKGDVRIDYCAGQYFPTEYRRAACAVLASALWNYWREHCMPEPEHKQPGDAGTYRGMSAGDFLRNTAKKEFGRVMAARWFN